MFSIIRRSSIIPALVVSLTGALATACTSKTSAEEAAPLTPDPIQLETAVVESREIDRFIRVTGSLAADEQAEVSAESGGRVVARRRLPQALAVQPDAWPCAGTRLGPICRSVGLADAAGARIRALVHIGCWFGNTFDNSNAARFGQMNRQFRFHGCIATKRGGQ